MTKVCTFTSYVESVKQKKKTKQTNKQKKPFLKNVEAQQKIYLYCNYTYKSDNKAGALQLHFISLQDDF